MMDKITGYRWLIAGIMAVGILAGAAYVNNGFGYSGVGVDLNEACQEQLGPEWQMEGYTDFPNEPQYDVKCYRDTGLLSTEEKWIEVPKTLNNTGVEQ